MAIGVTARGTVNTGTDATSFATGAFTPSANVLLVACYAARRGGNVPTTPTVTGHGTMTEITGFTWLTPGASGGRMWIFGLDTGASPGSAAVTFDHSGTTHVGAEASVYEVTGTDLSSGGGSSTVAQCFVQTLTTTADSSGTSASITLAAAGNSNNRPFSWWVHGANEAITPATSWTEIDDLAHAAPASGSESQWRSDAFDTAAAASWTTSAGYGGLATEIKALVASATVSWDNVGDSIKMF